MLLEKFQFITELRIKTILAVEKYFKIFLPHTYCNYLSSLLGSINQDRKLNVTFAAPAFLKREFQLYHNSLGCFLTRELFSLSPETENTFLLTNILQINVIHSPL